MSREVTWKLTKAHKILVDKGFKEEECRRIGDALFLVYHPTSDFYEQSVTEKKIKAQTELLREIEWDDISEAEQSYKEEVLPREVRIYNNLSHLLDYTLNTCEKVKEKPENIKKVTLTSDLLKQITLFCSKYTSLKEDLRKQRQQAKKTLDRKTLGNIALSASDERFAT